jgi:hypothetical protein
VSRSQRLVELVEERRELVAEERVCLADSTLLDERRVVEILGRD